jgi:predicted dehydrogenase
MRIGVVGLGSIGRRHVGNLLALGCEVVGMDLAEGARALAQSSYPTARIDRVLSFTGLDAIVIATPWDRHLEWVEEAIRRRLPFFVEKPLGSLEQLPRWREIATLNLPVNQVGYMLRFHPALVSMKAAIPSPVVGYFECACDSRIWPGGSYGPMLLEMSHEIDLALWFGAPPAPVVTFAAAHVVEIEFLPFTDRWRVVLGDRSISYRRRWYVGGETGHDEVVCSSPVEVGTHAYEYELAHFIEHAQSGTATDVPLSEGLKTLILCAQIEAQSQVSE